jgi:cobalt-zinc-cadmium efflux system membrane fusion protein
MKNHTYNTMKNRSLSLLAVASLLVFGSCSSKSDTQESDQTTNEIPAEGTYELSKTQFESSAMKLGKLEMKDFHEIVKANGIFDVPPGNRASVSSYFEGTVKKITLLPGEYVKRGQLLFILENPEFLQIQQDFLAAKGQLAYLKSDYERQKNLAVDNISSQKNYLKAESDYTVTKVKVESLSKKLELMNINPSALTLENMQTTINITSPINGYITMVNISRGTFLSPTQPAITIVNTDHIHLELNVFEKDLPKLRIDQAIRFRIQQDDRNWYKASVHLINKTVNQEDRTIGIHGHLIDEKLISQFNPGMYVEAEIYTTSASKAALPENTLVEADGKYYALVLDGTTENSYSFIKKEVIKGESNNGFVEVLNAKDFKADSEFLIDGAFNLITD